MPIEEKPHPATNPPPPGRTWTWVPHRADAAPPDAGVRWTLYDTLEGAPERGRKVGTVCPVGPGVLVTVGNRAARATTVQAGKLLAENASIWREDSERPRGVDDVA